MATIGFLTNCVPLAGSCLFSRRLKVPISIVFLWRSRGGIFFFDYLIGDTLISELIKLFVR